MIDPANLNALDKLFLRVSTAIFILIILLTQGIILIYLNDIDKKISAVNSISPDYFEEAFLYLMKSEGGYVNNKYDKGGRTKYGISQASYPNLDIENLKLEGAKKIYYNDFWKKYNVDKISHKKLAIKLFDTMVVVGARRSTLLLENAVKSIGFNIPVDGIFDPELIKIINGYPDQEKLIDEFQLKLEAFFVSLAKTDPTQAIFLQGWVNRARNEPPKDR